MDRTINIMHAYSKQKILLIAKLFTYAGSEHLVDVVLMILFFLITQLLKNVFRC